MGFYGSNNSTNSDKALKKVVVLRTGFNPTRFISPCYNTAHACNVHKIIHTQLECGPMPNVMVALPNIGGALCSAPQSLADAHNSTSMQ